MITNNYDAARNFAYSVAVQTMVLIYCRPVYPVEVDNDIDIDYEYLVAVNAIKEGWQLITVISAKELETA